jgi:nucleotide-binding universal stress UspA family protein
MPHVIVSYDGTRNDRDALTLGRLFAMAGADVSLAYVRHSHESDPEREAQAQQESERLLAAGAGQMEGAPVGQHVIVNPSTADGLASLAAELGVEVITFGSSYRTAERHVEAPQTAEQLIDAEIACSLALAPAGLRREPVDQSIGSVCVRRGEDDPAVQATASSLARALGATVTDGDADLIVIASRPDAPPGRLALSSAARERIGEARAPVLALARGASLTFG